MERADLGVDADTAIAPDPSYVAVTDGDLLPLDIPGWKALHEDSPEDNYVMVAGEMIHEALHPENIGLKNGDILEAAGSFQERMSFALLSADLSWPAALGSALGWEDRSVQKGHRYLYRVRSLADPQVVRVDTGYVMLSTTKPMMIPRPIITEIIERDKCIVLNWPRSAHEAVYTAYDIQRSDDGGGTFHALNKRPYIHFTNPDVPQNKDLITYSDSVPLQYKTYCYRLVGHTPFGTTGPPSDIRKAMARDRTSPPAPTEVRTSEMKAGEIMVTWTYPDDVSDLKGFHVVRGTSVSEPNTALTKTMLPRNARSFADRSAEAHQHHYYMVVAVDTAGNPGISLSALGSVLDSIPPATPVGFSGRVDTSGVVHLSWRMGKEPDLFGYYIYVRNQKDHIESRVNGQPVRDTVYTDTISVRTLTEHVYYRVVAIDMSENQSRRGEPLELARPDVRPPTAPVFTVYSVDAKGIHLKWAPSSSSDVVAHYLLRRPDRSHPWDTLLFVPTVRPQTAYLDMDKGTAAVYEYAILAKDDAGLFSERGKGLRLRMMTSDRPARVQGFKARLEPSANSVQLTWNTDAVMDNTVIILRSKDNGTFTEIERLSSDKSEWKDKLVKPGSSYTYTIQVVDQNGQGSDYATKVTVKP
ncbi:MAG TPA: hypothetical protein PLB89_00880 [Flavobacteriales bacterium]|nr:hypothetical protein [Flavobacteriales bacterium]